MSNVPAYSEQACLTAVDTLTEYLMMRSDGVFTDEEQEIHEARLRTLVVYFEFVNESVLFAIQVLRIPESAPNKPLWAKIVGVSELAQEWRKWVTVHRERIKQNGQECVALAALSEDQLIA